MANEQSQDAFYFHLILFTLLVVVNLPTLTVESLFYIHLSTGFVERLHFSLELPNAGTLSRCVLWFQEVADK